MSRYKYWFTDDIDAEGLFYIYILRCCPWDGKIYYVGQTSRLIERLVQHLTRRGAKATRKYPPCALVHLEVVNTRRLALKREGSLMATLNRNRPFTFRLPEEFSELFYQIVAMKDNEDLARKIMGHQYIELPIIDWSKYNIQIKEELNLGN